MISEKGEQKISEVTVAQAYSGLRGIKAFVCDTSSVSADKGLIIRGIPLLEMTHVLPEEVFYLLLTGKLPDRAGLQELQEGAVERRKQPTPGAAPHRECVELAEQGTLPRVGSRHGGLRRGGVDVLHGGRTRRQAVTRRREQRGNRPRTVRATVTPPTQ